jgi:hypothetical protein
MIIEVEIPRVFRFGCRNIFELSVQLVQGVSIITQNTSFQAPNMSAERPALSWAAKLAANSNDLLPVPPPSAASSSQPKSPAISVSKPSTAVATAPSVVADMPFSPIEPPIDGKLKYLIIDTGAIIKGHGRNFHTIAENMLVRYLNTICWK